MLAWMRGYYAIVDVTGDGDQTPSAAVEQRARALLAAGPCCLQLRAKTSTATAVRDAARALARLCRAAGVPFCVNDRLDLALLVGADLVHLGQDDLPLADARRIAAGRLRIGYSTHGPEQAAAAIAGGADYLGFGPIFDTRSKLRPDPTVGLAALRAVCATSPIPVVAIGGVTPDNVRAVASAGAAAAAVISAVDRAADPTAAGREVARAF
jgi:thiamine-phosphate pyrophosphorylase